MKPELIDIDIDDRQLQALMKKLAGRVQNMRPAMRATAGIMHDEVEENFAREGRPAWEPLAESTIKSRERRGHWPGSLLQVSGQLAASITQKSDAVSARVGTNKRYGAIQQLGGFAGRGLKVYIPARPYLTPTDGGIRQIEQALVRYLDRG